MINKIIHFAVYNRLVVFVFTALFIVAGLFAYQSLTIDAVPDITNVQVTVNTMVDGLAPEETERYITIPIESTMNGISGVTHVRSLTKFGLSQVTVNFEDGTDIYKARQQVSERLQSVLSDLPPGAKPNLGPITTGLGEIYFYNLEMDKIETGQARVEQLMELRSLQEWVIKPKLMTVRGVASVDTTGGYEKQFHIQPNPAKMAKYGIGFHDIRDAITSTNKNVGGGYIQQGKKQFLVQGIGIFESAKDISQVPIKSLESFKTITVGDVAKVNLGSPLRVGAALVEGKESVLGMVYLLSGDNSRKVALAIDQKINEIKKLLPEHIKIETLYNRSELVTGTINTVMHNLILGSILVIVILMLLMGNFRAAIITAFVIPLSLLFTFLMMNWKGMSGNLMSLGALDFGIIVDGAVIVIDNCIRKIHEKTKTVGRSLHAAELKETVVEATVETRKAAGFGELIILAVFIPIFALSGIEGKMFHPMATAFCFAIIGALIFSFTLVPALASIFLIGKVTDKEPWLMRMMSRLYAPVLQMAIGKKVWTVGIAIVAVVAGGFLFSRIGSEFMPQLNEGSIVIMFNRDVNIAIDEAVKMQSASEKVIQTFPEVKKVFSRIGTAEVATDPMGIYLTDTFIMLHDRNQWPMIEGKQRTKEELSEAIVAAVNEKIPDQDPVISQPIQMRFNELLEGTRADISLKIFSDDLNELLEISEKTEKLLKGLPGSGDVEAEMSDTSPILKITPKKTVLAQYGLSSNVVLDAVGTAIGGEEVGFLFEGVRRYPILIRLDDADRSNLETLKNLPIEIAPNMTLAIKTVADLEMTKGFGSIFRESSKRRAAILINPRGQDTQSFVEEAKALIAKNVQLPSGTYFEWGGNFKNLEKAKSRLALLTPIVLLLVFMMIFIVFKNLFQTLLIFSGIPLALVGGVLALLIYGLPFSISAGIGFIALSGIALLNGVVLVSYFSQLQNESLSGTALVIKGSTLRLRPVLMTALVEIFGFFPMTLSHGIGAEVQKPLAAVVIGGIISSTILTLIVLPTLYHLFEKRMINAPTTLEVR